MAHKKFRRLPVAPLVIALVIVALASALFSLTLGAEKVPVEEVIEVVRARLSGTASTSSYDTIIWELRMPRALLSILVGSGLAVAGAAMQTLVQNPLADPYLLGISSGASVGATAVIVLGVLVASAFIHFRSGRWWALCWRAPRYISSPKPKAA